MSFTREIQITPAYDERKKGHGIHGCNLIASVVGEKGAITFVLFTNWNLPAAQKYLDRLPDGEFPHLFHKPQPADIGYHSPEPMYEGQGASRDNCVFIGNKPCYTDGSATAAQKAYEIMVEGGSEALFKHMEEYYVSRFEKNEGGLEHAGTALGFLEVLKEIGEVAEASTRDKGMDA